MVLISTVLGGLAVTAADHTVSYWATAGSVRLGEPVTRNDLVAVQAKVPQRTDHGLLRTDEALPSRLDQLGWAASARAGTLVTRDLLAERRGTVELPIVVANGGAPTDLRPGDRIDVWASATAKSDGAADEAASSARRILSRARVLSRRAAGSVNGGSGQTVVVDVADLRIDGRMIAALSTARITIVRVS